MNSYITDAYKGILFCLAMVLGTHCTTGVYSITPYEAAIKNDADQATYTELKAIWERMHIEDEAYIINSIRSTMHAYFQQEPRQAQQWYSTAVEFIMDQKDFFIAQHKQHHKVMKELLFALPMTYLNPLVNNLGNAQYKAACIAHFRKITPPSSQEKLKAAEEALGEQCWARFKQWIINKGTLERLPKSMEKEMKNELEADRSRPTNQSYI